jgi:PAS domain S-box-containing protein
VPVRSDEFAPRFEPLRRLRRRHPVLRYGVAVGSVGLAVLARIALEGSLSSSGLPFITFFPALLVSAFIGGLGPGALSLGLSALAANYFFLPPHYSMQLTWADAVAIVVFLAVGGVIVLLIHLLNEAIDQISIQEENARLILETAPAGMIAVDENGVITMVNATAERLFGYQREELIGRCVDVLVPERLRRDHASYRGAYMVLPTSRAMGRGRDLFAVRKDGAEVSVEVGLNPIVRDNRTGALATVVDISERKAAERKQEILVREVQHRAKNLLSIVQAIAARTFAPDKPVEESRGSFESKIQALARTQDLFFATGRTTLDDIVRGELIGFPEQVSIEGAGVSLTPAAAQNFTLIVHELATNALKYGALSAPSGSIAVKWQEEGDQLALAWSEQGGPAASAPSHRGFGHVILNDLAQGFGAKVKSEYAGAGFRYELRAALSGIAEVVSPPKPTSSAA